MTAQTLTLTDFLLARIAEDEEAARAASPSPWSYPGIDSVSGGMIYDKTRTIGGVYYEQPEDHDGRIVRHMLALEADANGRHIARHDPARVLAECEAKRQIVEAFEDERVRRDIYNRSYDDGLLTTNDDLRNRLASNAHCRGLEVAMLALALPYADHPDYRKEWKP